jgi:hypothetical protein
VTSKVNTFEDLPEDLQSEGIQAEEQELSIEFQLTGDSILAEDANLKASGIPEESIDNLSREFFKSKSQVSTLL